MLLETLAVCGRLAIPTAGLVACAFWAWPLLVVAEPFYQMLSLRKTDVHPLAAAAAPVIRFVAVAVVLFVVAVLGFGFALSDQTDPEAANVVLLTLAATSVPVANILAIWFVLAAGRTTRIAWYVRAGVLAAALGSAQITMVYLMIEGGDWTSRLGAAFLEPFTLAFLAAAHRTAARNGQSLSPERT